MSLPADLEVALLLGYAVVVLAGARLAERLARAHFERARALRRGPGDTDHGYLGVSEWLPARQAPPRWVRGLCLRGLMAWPRASASVRDKE